MRKFIILLLYEAYIRKRYLIAFIIIMLGVFSLLADAFISSPLNKNVMIEAPFSLVGTGYTLIFSGLVIATVIKVITYIKSRKYI